MANETITGKISVREILAKYPGSRTVFDKYGLLECGGEDGPLEPIAFFATVHKVDATELLQELNELAAESPAAATPVVSTNVPASTRPGVELYKKFVKSALLLIVTGGATLGAVNLTMIARMKTFELQDYVPWWTALVQAHGHVQLYGWCGLFIMGVSYVVLPRLVAAELRSKHLAEASFWLMIGGILLRAYFQLFASEAYAAHWLVWGAAAELAAVTLYVCVVLELARRNEARKEAYFRYLFCAAIWFWITTAALLALSVRMVATGENFIPKYFDDPYLHATLVGFVGLFIFGVSLRTLPFFMGTGEPNEGSSRRALVGLNVGVVLVVLGRLIPQAPWLLVAGALVELVAIITVVRNIHIFEKPRNPVILEEVTRDYEKFVRIAYLWVLISGAMLLGYTIYQATTGAPVSHPWMGAYRHAITVGFVSMMIFGMAGRIVPVFEGQQLYSVRLFNASFWLLNIGNLMRVVFQILAGKFGGAFYVLMGVSSYFEVTACGIFTYVLWRTMDGDSQPSEAAAEGEPTVSSEEGEVALSASTKVIPLVERYPATLEVLLRHGFSQLQNPVMRNTIGKVATLGMVCQMHGVNLAELIPELDAVIHPQVPRTDTTSTGNPVVEKLVWTALTDCYDPEIPDVNIVDLGLVYGVAVNADGECRVTMTLTTQGCPMADTITQAVESAVANTPGVRSAKVGLVFDPPWSPERMSPSARQKLGF